MQNTIKPLSIGKVRKIIKTLDDQRLSDNDCFVKIEEILYELEDNGIHCERHDFG